MKRTKFYCQCGCHEVVKPGSKYIPGHNLKADRFKRVYTPLSEEHKKKISKLHSGKRLSNGTKNKISEGLKGRSLSEEHKRNISNTKTGIELNLSKIQLEKLKSRQLGKNNSFYGQHHNEEVKQYLRELQSNRKLSEETKRKIGISGKGRKHSKTTLEKLSFVKQGKRNPNYGKEYSEEERKRFGSPKESHPNWKGGISYEPYSPEWTEALKNEIKRRDNYECKNPNCNKKVQSKLSVHHIDYNKKNCLPSNLITLCMSCNARANYNRKQHQKFYKELINKIIYEQA